MITAFATKAATTQAPEGAPGGGMGLILYLVVMAAIFYFILIRPQKKRQKEQANMLDNLIIGDEVVTEGGIMGKIVTIKEDSVVIETGADKTKIKFEKNAISRVLTIHE